MELLLFLLSVKNNLVLHIEGYWILWEQKMADWRLSLHAQQYENPCYCKKFYSSLFVFPRIKLRFCILGSIQIVPVVAWGKNQCVPKTIIFYEGIISLCLPVFHGLYVYEKFLLLITEESWRLLVELLFKHILHLHFISRVNLTTTDTR